MAIDADGNWNACTYEKLRGNTVAIKNKKPKGIRVTLQELAEAVPYMNLTPAKREFAKAVLRAAIEHVCMVRAGYKRVMPK